MRSLSFTVVILLAAAIPRFAHAEIKVTLVGSGGGPNVYRDRWGPSILVEAGDERLLFDCGRGVTIRLTQLGVPLNEVTKVFLTHLHSDHIVGLSDLLLTPWARTRSEDRRITPLEVWGPAGTDSLMSHLQQAYSFDIDVRSASGRLSQEGIVVQSHEIEEGVIFERRGVTVTAFLVDHGRTATAYGYRVDYDGYAVALSGDTRFSENLIEFAEGVDVLIHEAMIAEHPAIGSHTSFAEVGEVFRRVDPRVAVFAHATSMTPTSVRLTREIFSGRLVDGTDMMTIEIGDSVTVHENPGE